VLRNCIADEAKNRAVSSGFSGATEPDFALFVGSRAVAVEGTEGVQAIDCLSAIACNKCALHLMHLLSG
jgi:hypothetical protein